MRRVLAGLGILFVLLIAGILGLNLWVHSYLRSEAFRMLVAAKTGQALKADADYQPFDWAGSSVFSQALTARGEAGSPLESFDAEQVRANVDWKAVFHGAWRVERIDVVRFDAKIRSAMQQSASAAEPGPALGPQPPKRGILPNRFELDRVSVQSANLAIGELANIRGTALRMQPEGSGWVFDGDGGKLDFVGRPPLEIGSFRVRLQQGAVYLTDSEFHLGANGHFKASGEIGSPDAPFDLNFEWQNVDVADVLDAAWKDRVHGVLSGNARSLGRAGQPPLATGSFLLADGSLTGLPVQKEIAQFTRSPQFERMPLQQVSGDFTHDGRVTVVKNFIAESQGLLRLEGSFRVEDRGALEGSFRVGVTPQSLQWLPGSQEKIFTQAENGYLWTMVRVTGTLENPSEDLSARLARAMGEKLIHTGVEIIQGAPSNATDAVKKAVDILAPLIP